MESFDTYLRYVGNKEDHFEHLKPYSELSLVACVCSFQCILSINHLYIMLSLASLVPITSHYYINNSPLSSTYGDMTIAFFTVCKLLPLTVNRPPFLSHTTIRG